MDRCRCDEYTKAVEGLKFYTVGTYRPDIIENFDRSAYKIHWIKNSVSLVDLRMVRPRAVRILAENEQPQNLLSNNARMLEQMWCPYMTPYVEKN